MAVTRALLINCRKVLVYLERHQVYNTFGMVLKPRVRRKLKLTREDAREAVAYLREREIVSRGMLTGFPGRDTEEQRDIEELQARVRVEEDPDNLVRCEKCKNTGEVECQECEGFGNWECDHCDGDDDDCDCDGGRQECTECDGTGEAECPECWGWGGYRFFYRPKPAYPVIYQGEAL